MSFIQYTLIQLMDLWSWFCYSIFFFGLLYFIFLFWFFFLGCGVFYRFVRFVSTPAILERFVSIEKEILQIESSFQANALSMSIATSDEGMLRSCNLNRFYGYFFMNCLVLCARNRIKLSETVIIMSHYLWINEVMLCIILFQLHELLKCS